MLKSKFTVKKNITRIKVDTLADIAFVIFFCSPLISLILSEVFSVFGLASLADIATIFLIYFPLFLFCLIKSGKYVPFDFFVILIVSACIFGIAYLFHPEYGYWYGRENYGVWDYIYFPTEAIYAYLFVRLMDNPTRLFRNMKISGWIMYVYFFLQIYSSLKRGYWYGVGVSKATVEYTYSVSFGYNVLIFVLVFLHEAIKNKKASDIAGSVIGLYMIFAYGSRGPVLCIAIFLLLISYTHFQKSKNRWILILLIPLMLIVFLFYEYILIGLLSILSSLNINSRTIQKLLAGTITDDSNRSVIWNAAVQMIKDNPLGYGPLGSQPVISRYVYAGYPHSIFLEIWIDFGIIFGTLILAFLLINAVNMITKKENIEWRGAFIVLFCTSCQLLLSLCYWSSTAFWASIAVGVNCSLAKKRKRRAAWKSR